MAILVEEVLVSLHCYVAEEGGASLKGYGHHQDCTDTSSAIGRFLCSSTGMLQC